MFALPLQWTIFALLVALVIALVIGIALGRYSRRRPGASSNPVDLENAGLLLEKIPFGILLAESARNYRYANPYTLRLLGLNGSNGLLPKTAWSHLLYSDRKDVRQDNNATSRYRSLAISPGSAAGQGQTPQPDRFIRWWVTPLGDVDLVFLEDITSQQRAEESSRMLINDLSHELRTPLATILTHLEVLNLPRVSRETSEQSIFLLKSEARRMSRLANQLLELGRLETTTEIDRRPMDLVTVVEEVTSQVLPQAADRKISLSTEIDTPLPLFVGDGDRLRQVFLNLVDNAIKYSRPGDFVTVGLKRGKGGIRCFVRDTGPGIPARHIPYLTRRFYRAAPQSVEGSGLGLALVEEVLQRHNSRLTIDSCTEGDATGTCVQFHLAASDLMTDIARER